VDVLGATPDEALEIALSADAESVQVGFNARVRGGMFDPASPVEKKLAVPFDGIDYWVSGNRISRVTAYIGAELGPEARRTAYRAIVAAGEVRGHPRRERAAFEAVVDVEQEGAPPVTAFVSLPDIRGLWRVRFEPRAPNRGQPKAEANRPAELAGIPLPFHLPPEKLGEFLKSMKFRPYAIRLDKAVLTVSPGEAITLEALDYRFHGTPPLLLVVDGMVDEREKSRKKLQRFYDLLLAGGEIIEQDDHPVMRRVEARIPVSRSRHPARISMEWLCVPDLHDMGNDELSSSLLSFGLSVSRKPEGSGQRGQ